MTGATLNLSSKHIILVFDKSSSIRNTVEIVMGERCEVEGYGEVGEFLGRLDRGGVDLVVLGLDFPFSYYFPFLQSLRKKSAFLPVLFLSAQKPRPGILYPLSDFLMKPFFPEDLREKVEGLLFRGRWEERNVLGFSVVSPLEDKVRKWLGSWRVADGLREKVLKVSSLPISVLVEGEEGTGKRWVARGLHYLGSWKESVFVRVSGKGLEREGFLEELRGRVRGVDICRGLDIYIEDVEMLSWEMQGYLETEVEEGWVGEELGIGVEMPVRVLGSSGEDLRELVRVGEVRRGFGEMFWGERLKVLPLRERVGEIGGMVGEVLRERGIGKRVSGGALEELGGYEWPGNVEELEGLVIRTGMVFWGEEIGRGDWDWGFRGKGEEEKERIGEEEKGVKGEGSVEVLLSTLVHEVKNPLVAISTFAHLLPERYGEEEFRGEFSRLVGLEVRRLNGVLEMLLEYGQLETPRPVEVDLSKWVRNYCDEKGRSALQKILVELENPLSQVRFDDRHLNFVFERIFDRIQLQGIAGGKVRIVNQGLTQGENCEKLDIGYEEQEALTQSSSRKIPSKKDQDFEGLSLGLGLARRIMRKNNGEMSVLRDEEGRTRILLRFQGRTPRRSE